MTGNLAIKFHALHQQYGPIVRTAPNELSFIQPSAWKTIYGQQKGHYPPFSKNYDTFNETRNPIGRHSVFLADDENHGRMRKVLEYTFSSQALRDQTPRVQDHVNSLSSALKGALGSNGAVVDLNQWYTWAAFDIVTNITFGDSFQCLQQRTYREWPLQLTKTWKMIVNISGLKYTLPSLSLVSFIIPTSLLQKQVDRLDMIIERVKKRMRCGSKEKDLMYHLMRQNDDGAQLTEAEIVSNTSLLTFAGTETIATLLPALTYLLIQNPESMKRLVHDLRSTFPDEASITADRVSEIGYLTACIKEGLRLFPPTPEGLPRTAPPQGATISGHWVPGNVCTSCNSLQQLWIILCNKVYRPTCKSALWQPTYHPPTSTTLNHLSQNAGHRGQTHRTT